MKAEYDLSKMKSRKNPYATQLKSTVTPVEIENDILEAFRIKGNDWQNQINFALKQWLSEHPNFEHA